MKKYRLFLAVLLIAMHLTAHSTLADTTSFLAGDVDQDGSVTLADAQLILKASLKIQALADYAKIAADVDANGSVDLRDAQKALQIALKITGSTPSVVIPIPTIVSFMNLDGGNTSAVKQNKTHIDMLTSYFNTLNPAAAGRLDYLYSEPTVIVTTPKTETFLLPSSAVTKVTYMYVKSDGSLTEGTVTNFKDEIPIIAPEHANVRFGGFVYYIEYSDGSKQTLTFVDKIDYLMLKLMFPLLPM